MNCQRCNFDFGDMKPNYCPNCGKKTVWEESAPIRFKRVDYIRFLDRDRFFEFWKNVSPLADDEAYQWLQTPQPDVYIYTIEGKCLYTSTDWKGNFIKESERTSTLSISAMKEWLHNKNAKNCTFTPKKTILKRNFSPYGFGEKWWWTKEECNAAIAKGIESAEEEYS